MGILKILEGTGTVALRPSIQTATIPANPPSPRARQTTQLEIGLRFDLSANATSPGAAKGNNGLV
jgi:hypothetical protein